MHGTLDRFAVAARQRRRRHASSKATVRCEVLEERSLLTAFSAPGAIGLRESRAAETSLFGAGRQNGMFGRGSLGLGGGMTNPTLFLTAPLLDSAGGTTTPPSPSVMSSTAAQTAFQTLQTDLKNDTPSGAQATHASIGAVQDDLDAIRKGTLTGTAAVTQVQTDAAAVLSSMGLTAAQVTQIQTDQQAVQTALEANSSSSTPSTSSNSPASTSSTSSTATIAATESTLQSVSAYLIGIPGVSTAVGIRGMGAGGFGGGRGRGFGGGFGGGIGGGLRGGF
ncbi:MAG TPA: hypothetical protein VHS97_19910 [Isosphaeraceae bacterium]|nr:hypothetical protein [Isosphaeraceae bacterium]